MSASRKRTLFGVIGLAAVVAAGAALAQFGGVSGSDAGSSKASAKGAPVPTAPETVSVAPSDVAKPFTQAVLGLGLSIPPQRGAKVYTNEVNLLPYLVKTSPGAKLAPTLVNQKCGGAAYKWGSEYPVLVWVDLGVAKKTGYSEDTRVCWHIGDYDGANDKFKVLTAAGASAAKATSEPFGYGSSAPASWAKYLGFFKAHSAKVPAESKYVIVGDTAKTRQLCLGNGSHNVAAVTSGLTTPGGFAYSRTTYCAI